MPKYVFVVLTNPTEGRDSEFNRWYDERHLGEVLSLGPFRAVERFRIVETSPEQASPYRYLALYEVDAPSPEAARQALRDGVSDGSVQMSPALDRDAMAAWFFEPITDRRTE